MGQEAGTRLTLGEVDDGLLAASADEGVTLPMANQAAGLDGLRAQGNRPATGDMAAQASARGIAFAALFLTSEEAPRRSAGSLVGIDALVDRLMADRQMRGDLLGTVLQGKSSLGFLPYFRQDARRVAAIGCPGLGQALCRPGSVAAQSAVAGKRAADGGRVTVEQLGDLALCMAGFEEDLNLVWFVLGQMRVVYWATSTWRLMGQNAHAF